MHSLVADEVEGFELSVPRANFTLASMAESGLTFTRNMKFHMSGRPCINWTIASVTLGLSTGSVYSSDNAFEGFEHAYTSDDKYTHFFFFGQECRTREVSLMVSLTPFLVQ